MNKKIRFSLLTLLTMLCNMAFADAYTVDFNTAIATSSHDFAVASKWKHIVEDNDGSYVGYKWDAAYGTGDPATGGLLVYSQKVGSSSWDMATVYDLLVTPKVSGTIKLKVKAYENASSSTKAFVQFWSVNGSGTEKNDQLKEFQTEIPGYNTGSGEWIELTYDVTEAQRIGIRAQYVYIDDFYAEAVDATPEAALAVSSVMSSTGQTGTDGTNPIFEQQADGKMKVVLKVTLSNTGDVDFVAGTTENYTLTVGQASYTSGTKTYYEDASIAIPENIAVGETKTFDVEFTVPYISGYKYWYVKENVTGTTSNSYRYATSVAYESKFILRVAESTSTSDLTTAQTYGRISAAETRSFEIYNDGTAPLTIKSITLPEGFTSNNLPVIPEGGLELAKKTATAAFNVTLPVTTLGDFAGNLLIKYVKAGDKEETTKTLAFSGTVLAEGTWFADFNGDAGASTSGVYPTGSVVTSNSLQFGATGSYGSYDHYLKPYSSAGTLVMPKLTATAGAQLKYDAVKYQSGNSYTLKAYVSTDRKTWGEAKATISNSDLETSGQRYSQTLTFDEAGDYYVAFELYGVGLDNVIGLTKTAVTHDIYIKDTPLATEAQTGKEIKPSVTIIPLTDETAESYSVKYYVDGVAVATAESVELTSSATLEKTFTISYTPTDEVTTNHDTYIVFEFTDGTKIATDHKTLTVTNEPKFLFVAASTSVGQYSTNLTTAQAFGKVNVATSSKSFKIYNQGTAPLNVTSIVAPEGFSINKTEAFAVAAGESEEIIITFSATSPGNYSGDLVVTYTQEGAEPYKLAFSGTMLDPTKWYANFDNPTNTAIVWPAGSVYESSISSSYGNYSAPYNYYIYSRSTTNNKFTTPKLTAAAGDVFSFDVKYYSSYSSDNGTVKVYASATRNELGEPIATLTFENTSWETKNVTIKEAGDYYLTLEVINAYVDEIYGLTPATVAHDWAVASSNIPTEAMQNIASTATVNILNLGLTDEAADSYTVTAYVDGKVAGTSTGVAIPMNHKLSDAGTQLSVNFRYPKVGTFPVYIEVKAGDYTVATEPIDVTFAEEVAVAKAIAIGTRSNSGRDYGFVDWYNNDGSTTRKTDILYPAAKLTAAGINAGDKITSIAFRSVSNSAKSFKAEVTSWVGLSTGDITYGSPVKADMQQIQVYTGTVNFPANFESVITLTTPIVWDGNSDIRVYTEAIGQGSGNWISANYDYDSNINMYYNGTTTYAPLLYVTLAAESATLSGTVKTSADAAIAGATVTLKAANGVEYTGTTNAEGAYSINVIQAGLDFTVTVEAENYEAQQFAYCLEGSNKTLDIKFYPELTLNNSEEEVNSYSGKADVTVDRTLKAGWNAVVLPFALTADDITNAFGADAEVATYDGDEQNGDNVHINFTKATTVAAGVPFLLYLETAPASAPVFTDKAVNFTVNNAEGNVFDFVGTFANTTAATGDYILSGGKFKNAVGGNAINAYRAYLKLKGAAASRVSLYIDGFLVEDEATAITGAKMNAQQENVYSLSGQKINNQLKKGIYIINGKKVVIK